MFCFYQSLISFLQYPPWTTYVRDDHGKFIKYSGVIFELLTQVSHKLNFTYSVHEPPDGKYGNEQSDGSYNGMIKQVRG